MKKKFYLWVIIYFSIFIIFSYVTICCIKKKEDKIIHRRITKIAYEVNKSLNFYQNIGKNILKSELFQYYINKGDISNPKFNYYLEEIKRILNISIIYIMNRKGDVIFSTTYAKNKTLLGNNYNFRPYFKEAIKGNSYIFIARGVTTYKRGIYYSFPVYSKNKKYVKYVLVIKVPTDEIDKILKYNNKIFNYKLGIVSPENIILSSSDDSLLYSKIKLNKRINLNHNYITLKSDDIIISKYNKNYKIHKYSYYFHILKLNKNNWRMFIISDISFKDYVGFELLYLIILILFIGYTFYRMKRHNDTVKIRELSTAVEQTKASIVITDLEGKIEYVNKAFEEETGYKREEVIGKKTNILKSNYHHEEYYKKMWKTITSGKTWEGEFYNKRKDGTYYWERAIISPIRDEKNRIIKYIAIKDNITELKKIQKELEKAKERAEEANKLKSIFLSNMSHEIRTPLNAIIGFTNVLYENETDKEKKEKLEIIQQAGKHLLKIINDILDLSKIEAGNYLTLDEEEFSLKELINSIVAILKNEAEKKRIELKADISKECPDIFSGDPVRINQILMNLVGNAIKFTDKGGVYISCECKDNNVIIKIKDTGIGIPKEKIKTVFAPFIQGDNYSSRRYGGTGLGLAISKKLVELMGGDISVTSELGKGSIFTIKLPLKVVKNKIDNMITKDDEIKKNDLNIKRILIVDDVEFNILLIKEFLKDYDLEIDTATNGKEALEKIEKNSYDLVLLDIKMPVLDGYEVLKKVRADDKYKNMKIFVLTASALKEETEKYFQAGADDYIVKPVNKEELLRKIFNKK